MPVIWRKLKHEIRQNNIDNVYYADLAKIEKIRAI